VQLGEAIQRRDRDTECHATIKPENWTCNRNLDFPLALLCWIPLNGLKGHGLRGTIKSFNASELSHWTQQQEQLLLLLLPLLFNCGSNNMLRSYSNL